MGRFVGGRPGEILVVAETLNARDSLERRHGFDRVIARDFGSLTALPTLETHGDAERTRAVVRHAYANHRAVVGAYVLSSEARVALEAIAEVSDLRRQTIIAHERTRFSEISSPTAGSTPSSRRTPATWSERAAGPARALRRPRADRLAGGDQDRGPPSREPRARAAS